jgi:phage shock protein A
VHRADLEGLERSRIVFKRLANLFKGFLGMFIKNLETSNPRALLEAERENLRKNIAQYNDNLANQAALADQLKRRITELQDKERKLTDRINLSLKTGNREAAGHLALNLESIQRQLETAQQKLVQTEESYKKMLESRVVLIESAKEKLENLKRMITETEMLEAEAELKEMTAGLASASGGAGDTINRLTEQLQEQRSQAAGRSKVADASLVETDPGLSELDLKARAEQALAEFEATQQVNQTMLEGEEPTDEPPESRRELGPRED